MSSVMLKVCCIATLTEARMAISAGATAIGLVGPMPSGPGIISDLEIHQIAQSIKNDAWTVLLTSRTNAVEITDHVKSNVVNTVQLVDDPQPGTYQYLRKSCPTLRIIQVIHVEDESAIEKSINISPLVDVILLDSGRPSEKTKILGGTGQTHNWSISRKIVQAVNNPVFLAGGINPNNVCDAINLVRPAGIDLCTGIREQNALSAKKLSLLTSNIERVNGY